MHEFEAVVVGGGGVVDVVAVVAAAHQVFADQFPTVAKPRRVRKSQEMVADVGAVAKAVDMDS